jgi:hypothetical protein
MSVHEEQAGDPPKSIMSPEKVQLGLELLHAWIVVPLVVQVPEAETMLSPTPIK